MTQGEKKSLKLAFYKACAGAVFLSGVFGGVAEARSVDFDSYDERMARIAVALTDASVTPKQLVRMGYSPNNAREIPQCREDLAGSNPTAARLHKCTNQARETRFVMAFLLAVLATPVAGMGLLCWAGSNSVKEMRRERLQREQKRNQPGPRP